MSFTSPFKPQQRVIVCLDEPESGGRLGHYGTIIGLLAESKARFPHQPDMWSYRVSVPYLNCNIDVPVRSLLATERSDYSESELDRKIIFDNRSGNDNQELKGSYRLSSCGVTYFAFRKSDTPVATFQLEMQMKADRPESLLEYHVPQDATLNAEYVRQAIRDILGLTETSDNNIKAS